MTARQHRVPSWFGGRLRAERERRGWSMRDLSGRCGVNASTILRAEHGGDISLALALAMAAALGVPLGRLVAETPCPVCDGMPPAGFICGECGRGGVSRNDISEGGQPA